MFYCADFTQEISSVNEIRNRLPNFKEACINDNIPEECIKDFIAYPVELAPGIYQSHHILNHLNVDDWGDPVYMERDKVGLTVLFNGESVLGKYFHCTYGLCDSVSGLQDSEFYKHLLQSPRTFIVQTYHIAKESGIRWHKHGPYIGKGIKTCESISDEDGFDDGVWSYMVFMKK